jgi:sulfite reductase alpha subunit-like flavoprotein
MVENQVPAEIPVAAEEGVTFPADRFPMAYKRAWREFIEHGGIRKQAPSTEVNRTERLAVCWGSQSGNAERLAASLVHDLEDRGLSAQLFDMDLVTPSDLRAFDAALIICSTYGAGDPPDNAADFLQSLDDPRVDLGPLQFSVCALGDSSYEHFCGCGKALDRLLEERGGRRMVPRQDCDADYDESFAAWRDAVVAVVEGVGIAP